MKQVMKRSLAMLLLLVVLVGYFSGITIRASAASYTYNWGTRGDVADQTDFARSTAEEWYDKYNVTLEDLLNDYSGASSTSSVPSSTLYKRLKSLMTDAHSYINAYKTNNTLLAYTDCQNGGGAISSFYSGKSIGPSWDGSWNKEHTWPNSKGLDGSDEDDVMMIRPTAVSENSSRGNTAYGESGSYYHPNQESDTNDNYNSIVSGELDLRGDCARICLYVYVRWGNTGKMWGSSGVMESKEVLLQWMEEDPVDTWELGRNDSVQSITGTRNVFVDYPELAFALFNEDVPAGYTSPSGGATSSYTVTATSNNTSYGTVSVSGKTITATPKTGYYAAGYTVTSGTATVTQNGNVFTVSPSSNCTVRINFAAKTAYTVTYLANGAQYASKTAYGGDVISLSSYTGTLPEGYSFNGWVKATVSDTETKPATVYTAGSSYTVTANTTFYALFSYQVDDGNGTSNEYVLYNGALTEGDYIIVYESSAMVAADADSSGRIDYTTVSVSSNTIKDPKATVIWHIAPNGSYWTIYNEENGVYAAGTGTKNKSTVSTSLTDYGKWTATGSSTYEFKNLGNANKSVNALLRCNGNYGFACYSSSTGGALSLYKATAGATTYYTTSTAPACDHIVVVDEAVEATCQSTGLTEGSHCSVCNEVFVAQTVIAIVPCDYQPIVTAPTCTVDGYSTYTCVWCGEVDEVSDYVAATGHNYSAGICTACGDKQLASWNIALGDNIAVNFVMNTEEAVSFTVAGKAVEAVQNGNTYSIYLAAAQMTDEIVICVGGEALDETYSVRKYADIILAGDYEDAVKNLVNAMLCYGGSAQTYFGYNTGALANDGIEMTAEVPTGDTTVSITDNLDGVSFYGASLVYRNKTAVRFYFSGDVAGLTFSQGTARQKDGLYYVEIGDINPQNMGDTIELVITDAEGNTLTVGYSPLIYIVRMYEKASSSETTKSLVQAFYNYYLAADAYIN